MCVLCRFGYTFGMRRIAATLTVVGALILSVGSTFSDDPSEANELFAEAVKLVNSVEMAEGPNVLSG